MDDFWLGLIIGIEICKITVIIVCVVHYLMNKR